MSHTPLPPPPPPPVPAIAETGVVVANLLPTINAISRDSIISIFGSDFAPSGFRDLDTQVDPATGLVATNQSGVCVEIDGRRAPMFHVLSNQLNLQAPTLMGAAPVSVVVITNCGTPDEQRSAPEPVQLVDRTPAFFVEPIVDPGGANPIAALHQDGVSLVGDPELRPGATPAEPGEFISLFGTGFGLTNPPLQAGQIPANVLPNGGIADIDGPFSITIGGMTLEGLPDVFYAGIAPCCAGLYQIVVRVPDGLPDGNHEVTAMVDGVSTLGGPYIPVRSPSTSALGADAPESEEPGGNDVTDDGGSGGDGSSEDGGGDDTSGGGGSGGEGSGGGGAYLRSPGAGTRGPTLFPPTSSARGR